MIMISKFEKDIKKYINLHYQKHYGLERVNPFFNTLKAGISAEKNVQFDIIAVPEVKYSKEDTIKIKFNYSVTFKLKIVNIYIVYE